MANIKPLVSIGLPIYNEEHFAAEALESLLSQSFGDFELIISDNASTDGTADICREYAEKDPRILYHRLKTNIGGVANTNRTFELSNSEYFFWASGHDLWDRTFISQCLKILEDDESVVLCYPIAKWLQYDGTVGDVIHSHIETRGLGRFAKFNIVLWGIQYAYPMYGIMRSSALRKSRLLEYTIATDVLLLTDLSFYGAFAEISEPLLYMRQSESSGNWRHYYQYIFGSGSAMPSSLYLFSNLLGQFIRVIAKHGRSFPERLGYIVAVIFCMFTKYRSYLYRIR